MEGILKSRCFGIILGLLAGVAWLRAGTPQSKPVPEESPESASALPAPAGRREIRKHGRPTVLVNGHILRPGVQLRGVSFRDADLRWVDLRQADLRGADLTGAKLCGSNLSGALLGGTILTGADLEDAILFGTQTFGAVGADFSRAHLHPFFSDEKPEEVGAIRLFLGLRRHGLEPIRNFLASPSGSLYWLNGEQGHLGHLTATGAVYGFGAEHSKISEVLRSRQYSMALDGNNHLILVGERWFTFFNLNASEGTLVLPPGLSPFRATGNRIPAAQGPPLQTIRSAWGSVLMVQDDAVLELRRHANGTTDLCSTEPLPGYRSGPLLLNPADRRLYYLDAAGQHLLGQELLEGLDYGAQARLPLAQGSRPDLLALGGDGRIWAARRGEGQVVGYSTRPDLNVGPLAVTLPDGARLHQITGGPDGNLWATDPAQDRLWRVTPAGVATAFPLPPGMQPAEILTYLGGRLLFTSMDGNRVGSIRAVASPGRVLPELPVLDTPAAQAATRTELTASEFEQLEEHVAAPLEHQLEELREEGLEAGLPLAPHAPAEGSSSSISGAVLPVEAAALEVQEARRADPQPVGRRPARQRLADRGLLLTRGALKHILTRHQASRGQGCGQFSSALSEPEALSELIAGGLLEAERHGVLGRIRMWDRLERSYTLCSSATQVGTYQSRGQAIATRTFLVVTAEYYDPETRGRVRGVVTAYPVSPTW